MKLVVDTNILLSFFRDNPIRKIILYSELFNLELHTPEHGFKELLNIKNSLSKYSKLPSEEIDFILDELKKYIKIIPDEFSKSFESQAKQLIHDKDVPIFALALKLNCSIWSNEPGFKEQSSVKVFNTEELRKQLKL